MTTDRNVLASAALSDDLRAWLRARPESDQVIASALVYEVAALLARNAPSLDAAIQLVDEWVAVMKHQIRRCGVGVEHP